MSSYGLTQIKFALGIGSLFTFYGIAAVATIFIGDNFGYSRWTQAIVVIALVVITAPIALIVGFVSSRRERKAKEKEEAEKAEAEKSEEEKSEEKAKPAETYLDLTNGAEETVQFLKNSNLGVNGKDAVYALPWYLVMGTPKSGKSSLVLGSNLDFETLPSQRQSEQKFVRPTRNVDWRVTNDAVFLDTAGRYQTEGVDEEEWSSLLETIKKNRGNRPIDGLVLAIDTNRILKSDEREIEETAKVLRARLDDVRQRLQIRFPVYLVFTHADSIEGFRDSFSTSKQEGKNLVWGATIPLEKSDNAQSLFDGEFEILQDAIMKRRLMRLSAPFPPVRQLRIFNFPLHFSSARRKLGTFVMTLFRPNPFNESPFLRGFYFTAAPLNKVKTKPGQTMGNLPQTVGNTYFTERFFRDVLLRDKDLVKTFQEQKQKPPIWGWMLTGLGTVLVLGFLIMVGVSLANNKLMLDDAAEKGRAVITNVQSNADANPLEKNADKTQTEIKTLIEFHDLLANLDRYEREGAPFYMRFGLYSGDSIYKNALLPIFYNAVEQRFKTPALRHLEADLKKFSEMNITGTQEEQEKILGENYEKLEAYLMLSGEYKNRAAADALVKTLKPYWLEDSKIPADLKPEAEEMLKFWAKQVDRGANANDTSPEYFPRIKFDEDIVKAARLKLQNYPAHARYYHSKVREISEKVEDAIGETTVEKILLNDGRDAQFVKGSYKVQGAFTKEGYELMKTAISEANEKLSDDDWVLGEQGKKAVTSNDDASKVEAAYQRDYATQWLEFVKGLSIAPYQGQEDADKALQSFGSPSSPITLVLQKIEYHTNLSAEKKAASFWDYFSYDYWFGGKNKTETGGNTQVEKDFRPLFGFVGDAAKSDTPLDKYNGAIGKVATKFSTFSPNDIQQIADELRNDNDKSFTQLRRSEGEINTLLGVFASSGSASTEISDFLQEPLGNLKILLGADAKTQLAKTWSNELLPKAREMQQGFPFEDGSNEAKLNKITEFLNPVNGKLTEFYKKNLKNYFEEKDGQLILKEGSPITPEFAAYLNNAFKLRKALFGESSATPKFEYEFRLEKVADTLIEMTIDGKDLTSEGASSAKLTFPASSGETNGVFMKIESTAGTTTTSGSTLPTNTAENSNTGAPPVSPFQSNSNSTDESKEWKGEWGLFRFFYDGKPSKQNGEYNLNYSLGGKTVKAIIKPLNDDLFDRDIFRKLSPPDNLLK